MASKLSGIPIAKRRHAAATLGLFATLFVAVGAVAATGSGRAAAPAFTAVALVIAVLLGMIAWGIMRTISEDLNEERLDAMILAAISGRPEFATLCSCGHDHDPSELHITDEDPADEACAHDGGGAACAHDCSTCVLAALRPSPTRTRADRLSH